MTKVQSAVLARVEEKSRLQLSFDPPPQPSTLPPQREPRTADRIRDALLQWLEEEA